MPCFHPSGERFSGEAAHHHRAQRGEAEESFGWVPRLQADLPVALVSASPRQAAAPAARLALPRHRYNLIPAALDRHMTQHHVFIFFPQTSHKRHRVL